MRCFQWIVVVAATLVPVTFARGQDTTVYINYADFQLTLTGLSLEGTVTVDEDEIPLIMNYSVDENGIMRFSGRFENETEYFIEGTVEEGVAGGWVTKVEQGAAMSATPYNAEFLSDGVDMISFRTCECDHTGGSYICAAADCQHNKDCSGNYSDTMHCAFSDVTTNIESVEIFGSVF